jgi:hypothetical protein
MTKPIPDKAEVALEYPDKLYIGTFERSSRFDAHLDEAGIPLRLERTGAADIRKSIHMHFHMRCLLKSYKIWLTRSRRCHLPMKSTVICCEREQRPFIRR